MARSGARGWTLVIVVMVLTAVAAAASADEASFDDLEIHTVDEGPPARVLFSAPAALATRTLTTEDLDVRVDGAAQPARLQRLSGNDLEVAVVLDTTLSVDRLRELQAAIVELALTLPQGASMRLIDAEGKASAPAPVPGPAIAAIRSLQSRSGDAMTTAVDRAVKLLDDSSRGRSTLLVVGRDLATRLDPVDDRPLHSLSYLIDVGGGSASGLLGPDAGGEAVTVDSASSVLAVVDDIAQDLRALYLAEIPLPDRAARTLSFALTTDVGDTRRVRLDLGAGTRVPAPAQERPAARPGPGGSQAAPDTPAWEGWLPWLIVVAVLVAVAAALAVWLPRSRRRPATVSSLPVPVPPPLPLAPRRHRTGSSGSPPQRPIAKLTPETRQALAGAYRGLRRLAVTSRETVSIVPDQVFRLTEARASAALSGHDRSLPAALHAALTHDEDPDSAVVHRAAAAVLTGWQHTARRQSAPPAVVEINALLHGVPAGDDRRPSRPIVPVRALDPLVEIGLEHMVLAAQPDDHAGLVARAVTVVDVMRAARLARPFLALSEHLLTDVDRYRAACRADPGDPADRDDWLTFFFEAIARRSHVAVDQLRRLRHLRERYRDAARDTASMRLVDLLLGQPMIDTALIARRLALPVEHAGTIVATAQGAGWLEPYPDDPEVWVAADILGVFTATLEPLTEVRDASW